jgi:hypothetical protein
MRTAEFALAKGRFCDPIVQYRGQGSGDSESVEQTGERFLDRPFFRSGLPIKSFLIKSFPIKSVLR